MSAGAATDPLHGRGYRGERGVSAALSREMGSKGQVSVFAFVAPADLREGFDGLASLVSREFKRDPATSPTCRSLSYLSRLYLNLS